MGTPIDILFVTRPAAARDSGQADRYRDLRFEIEGRVAEISVLRAMAGGLGAAEAHEHLIGRGQNSGVFPVLTPIYLEEFFGRQGLVMKEIPCLVDDEDLAREYIRDGVRVIALCTTWLPGAQGLSDIRKAAARLRAMAPGVPIVVGGMGARKAWCLRQLRQREPLLGLLPGWLERSFLTRGLGRMLLKRGLAQHFLLVDPRADRDIDAIVTCEGGEATLAAIARRRREGRDFRDLPNLAIPDGADYRLTASEPEAIDVDAGAVDWRRHARRLGGQEAPVRSGTGCPFRCGFCDFQGLQEVRIRSHKSLLAELRTVAQALPPPRRVYFVDDNLASSRRQLVEFARALAAEKLDLSWRAFLRADAIDAQTAVILRESGCRECLLGMESGDPQVLRNMNKRMDPQQALRGVEALDSAGISTVSTFVVGFPGECGASVERTSEFISGFPSGEPARAFHRYYLFPFMVSPLSPVAGREPRTRFGLRGVGENWAHRTMNVREAGLAMREVFLRVKGPAHFYMEQLPKDWSAPAVRRVIELRDLLQKERLESGRAPRVERLLRQVRHAESLTSESVTPVTAPQCEPVSS